MKKHLSLLLKIGIAVGCLALIFAKIGIKEIAEKGARIDPVYLLLPLLLMLMNRFLMAWKWSMLLKARNIPAPLSELIRITFVSNFVGLMIPMSIGVDAIRLYEIQRSRFDIAETAGSILADRIIAVVVLALLSLVGIFLAWNTFADTQVLYFILAASLAILVGTAVVTAPAFQRLVATITGRHTGEGVKNVFQKTLSLFLRVHESISGLVSSPKHFLPVAGIAVLVQLSRILQIHFIFLGLGLHPGWVYEMAFLPMIILLTLLPITPMGLGIKEGAFIYFFRALGMNPAVLVAASLYTHALNLLVILPGAWLFLVGKKRKDPEGEAPDTAEPRRA